MTCDQQLRSNNSLINIKILLKPNVHRLSCSHWGKTPSPPFRTPRSSDSEHFSKYTPTLKVIAVVLLRINVKKTVVYLQLITAK